jgi:hypothetical protein
MVDCLKSLLFQYLGLDLVLTKARVNATSVEFVLSFDEGNVLHVMVPQIALVCKQGTASMQQLQKDAAALQLSYVPENQMDAEFFALYSHLEHTQQTPPSDDISMRCAAFQLVRTTSDLNSTVLYQNPKQDGRVYVHQNRSKGHRYSTASGDDTGLVREGNLLQVLRMRRTYTAIFTPQSETPTSTESMPGLVTPEVVRVVAGTSGQVPV